MSVSLSRAVSRIFELSETSTCYPCATTSSWRDQLENKYMVIPVTGHHFEVPIFVLQNFNNLVAKDREYKEEAMVVKLDSYGFSSRYKSVERAMTDVIIQRFSSRLAVLAVNHGTENIMYYGTMGALFNSSLKPMMICSYLIERLEDTQEDSPDPFIIYRLVRPIIRVSPEVFLDKKGAVEKIINNKILTECLSQYASLPPQFLIDHLEIPDGRTTVKVEIDSFPFSIQATDRPSISTTNKELLQVAIDHIHEIIGSS